jgi:(2R)-sulfolactate sulfo-lyase subunit alpha
MTSQSAAQPTGSTKPGQKAPDFLVHEDGDSVGVIVIEGLKAGTEMTGWIMAQDRTVSMKVLNDIPIGHKVALTDLKAGDSVIKYGVNIGKVVAPIKKGEHVHVHNLKTRRW